MPITRRDNAVVVVLVLSLVVLGGVIAMPVPVNDAAATPEPTPEVTLPPPVTYREGVVGVPADDHARRRAHAVRAHARRPDLQRPRPPRSRQHLRARPRRVVDDGRQGQDVDVQDPRRRDLAGRRAGDGTGRRVHRRGAQGPRGVGRDGRRMGRRHRDRGRPQDGRADGGHADRRLPCARPRSRCFPRISCRTCPSRTSRRARSPRRRSAPGRMRSASSTTRTRCSRRSP